MWELLCYYYLLVVDFDSECDEFYNNSCFKLLQNPRKQWTASETDCNDIGGYLTSIHSENENEMLANHLKVRTNDPGAIAWIGFYYDRNNQSTTWLDGSLMTFTNNYMDTRSTGCMTISANKDWYLDSCDEMRQFICRKTGEYFFLQYVVGHQ